MTKTQKATHMYMNVASASVESVQLLRKPKAAYSFSVYFYNGFYYQLKLLRAH